MASPTHHFHFFLPFLLLLFLLLLGIWTLPTSSRPLNDTIEESSMRERHGKWMAEHGRTYVGAEEKELRFKIFKDNLEYIEAFNKRVDRGFKLGLNQFADLTNEEFRASWTGYKGRDPEAVVHDSTTNSFRQSNVTEAPPSLDWRTKGAVTAVKHQGRCGCCWAFSAVAAVEGINVINTGRLISLSEQQLVDCDVGGEDRGCESGFMDGAFKFIIQNNGLTTESNYPYIGERSTCNTRTNALTVAKITGYKDVPANNENALLQAVAEQPVSVAVDGRGMDFQFYKSGVFTGTCETQLNHAITAIGYGVESDGTKYWLFKNSWGTAWGENGYMRMERDVANEEGLCGIAMKASYPVM